MHYPKGKFWVEPGKRFSLKDLDPGETSGLDKKKARKRQDELSVRLNVLQEQLYASEKHALLIVLQGMDTAGKDGVIKRVVDDFNPQGCRVTSFKVPTREDLAHDFLWRIHKATPGRGEVGIFNRSHYEDVLVVRVENLAPPEVWKLRYRTINEFERTLSEAGVLILKFMLHISRDEQKSRLESRLETPSDQWKFKAGDLKARAKWDDYMAAYEDALTECSTKWAPWYVIPADNKWHRDLAVSEIILETLDSLEMQWPPLEPEAVGIQFD
ncbi:MAG: polyphosphate kinase 2 family protein [Chloroflexota bacterium]